MSGGIYKKKIDRSEAKELFLEDLHKRGLKNDALNGRYWKEEETISDPLQFRRMKSYADPKKKNIYRTYATHIPPYISRLERIDKLHTYDLNRLKKKKDKLLDESTRKIDKIDIFRKKILDQSQKKIDTINEKIYKVTEKIEANLSIYKMHTNQPVKGKVTSSVTRKGKRLAREKSKKKKSSTSDVHLEKIGTGRVGSRKKRTIRKKPIGAKRVVSRKLNR
jgi:hypothetical protein